MIKNLVFYSLLLIFLINFLNCEILTISTNDGVKMEVNSITGNINNIQLSSSFKQPEILSLFNSNYGWSFKNWKNYENDLKIFKFSDNNVFKNNNFSINSTI
jgi:hypothetical protein